MRRHLTFYINGQRHSVDGPAVFANLTDYLRNTLRLTGTKVVCAEGDCGSCTVLLGKPSGDTLQYEPVCGCIKYLFQLDGMHVVTVEGLAYDGALNPVQCAMAKCHGAQCGYCTPGFIVTMHHLLDDGEAKDENVVRRRLTGNLCRCTGYEPILRAAAQTELAAMRSVHNLDPPGEWSADLAEAFAEPVLVELLDRTFYKPTTLEEAAVFRAKYPNCMVVAGGTDIGVVMNKRGLSPAVTMSTHAIAGFDAVEYDGSRLRIGGGATYAQMKPLFARHLPELDRYIDRFGSPQIRNAGTLAGNLATGSPIGDSLPPLMVLNAVVTLVGPGGRREINLNDFYTGYRQSLLQPDELIALIDIPVPAETDLLKLYKISNRADMDISTFSAAIWMRQTAGVIEDIRIACGGVGPTVLRMRKTENVLRGRAFDEEVLEEAGAAMVSEVTPISDVRGSADYRKLLAANILRRLHAEIAPPLSNANGNGRHH